MVNKGYVKPSAIKEGDDVMVKRDETKNKGDTLYNPIHRLSPTSKGLWSLQKMLKA